MKLKNLRLSKLLLCLAVGMIWPVIKYFTAEDGKLVAVLDGATIAGLVLVAAGIIWSAVLHGDYDVTEYNMMRVRQRRNPNMKSFDTFKADRKQEREGSFNYPLFVGLLMLAICAVISLVLF